MAAYITEAIKQTLNRLTAGTQKQEIGTIVETLSTGSLCVITKAITADATSGLSITIPFDFELLDVVVQARASVVNGTATVRKSTTAITDAIIMAVDTTITRAGTIDDAQSTILTTDSINVITTNAGDRGLVTLIGKRA